MEYTLESMYSVKGRVVAITGGCGGIGKGLAEALLKLGARVAIIDMNEQRIGEVVAELTESAKGEIRGYAANITEEASVRAAFEKIYADFGSLYGLVNCAGTTHVEYLSTMPIEEWQKVMDVNLRGTVLCTKVAGEYMTKCGAGRVINFSSLASTHGKPQYTAYTPSKSAIDGFTFTLAAEWARKNITVNAIAPVFVLSVMTRKQWEGKEDQLEKIAEYNPQGRNCSPELLSGLLVFLLSDSASYVNGQVIGCDGGATRGAISPAFRPEGA